MSRFPGFKNWKAGEGVFRGYQLVNLMAHSSRVLQWIIKS